MAVLTTRIPQQYNPHREIKFQSSNSDVGVYDYVLGSSASELYSGFSIVTGTLSGCTIKLFAQNDIYEADVTNDLYGKNQLQSTEAYITDIPIPCEKLILRIEITNASNEVNLALFAPKRGGR